MKNRLMKIIAAALALCLALSATGCTGGESSTEGTAEAGTVQATSEAEQTEEQIKVGYIFGGETEDGGFSAECNAQRLKAAQHSSAESVYIDGVKISDLENAVKALIDDGCTHIVSSSATFTNAITDIAGRYMNANFISYGARVRSANIGAYTEHIYQGAYIAGMAAAYNSTSEKIGMVVDPNLVYMRPVINAAALGAQLVYAGGTVMTGFASRDSEIDSAVDALVAQGCDVIISYTESIETERYCESNGIKFISNHDLGTSVSSYENLIMTYYATRDSYYLAQFKEMTLGEWEPLAYVGTLANGVIHVSDVQPAAREGTQDIVSALTPKVSSGSAYIFMGELKDVYNSVRVMQEQVMTPNEIYAMDWYVLGVDTSLDSFIQPNLVLTPNSLEIKQ